MPNETDLSPDDAPAQHYTGEALAACEKALRTIVAKVGSWGPRLILFGGLAPRYLVPEVPDGVEAHLGTTDLDVVLGITVVDEEEAVYTKLQQELRNAGFEPSGASYAWERRIDDIKVVIEFFCPVEDGEDPGSLRRNPGGETGSTISAIRLRGAELAGEDYQVIELEGETLDHGGRRNVEIRVAGILPFLVLKAFAVNSRDKEKDAYDIVWTLNAFGEEGPRSAAEQAAESPVREYSDVEEGIRLLKSHFSELDAPGPSNYARFFLGIAEDDDSRDRLRRSARGVVVTFLNRWDEIQG